MTKLLCQTDSYLKEFDAIITGVDAEFRAQILDQTALYLGCGGQLCDFSLLPLMEQNTR